MAPTTQRLFEEALQMTENERADLALRLIDSLTWDPESDVRAAWDAEIAERIADIDKGRVKPIPWPEARRMIVGPTDESTR